MIATEEMRTLPGTDLHTTAAAHTPTRTMAATVTNGSQEETANAAPAAAAAIAVQAVWQVAKIPCIRPTSLGCEPWVRRDCTAGMAAAKPRASVPPSNTN